MIKCNEELRQLKENFIQESIEIESLLEQLNDLEESCKRPKCEKADSKKKSPEADEIEDDAEVFDEDFELDCEIELEEDTEISDDDYFVEM